MYGNILLQYGSIRLIYCMGRFKIWEISLFAAVVLLAALVYETHNDGGRYVVVEEDDPIGDLILDTRTGTTWYFDSASKERVVQFPAIPKGF